MGYFNSYRYFNQLICDQSNETCVVTDMLHRTVCFDLRVINCAGTPNNPCGLAVTNGGLLICDPLYSWNCNLCPNDLPYFNLVLESDVLRFQFQQIDNANGINPNGTFTYGWGYLTDPNVFAAGKIIDCCTGLPIEKSPGVDLEVMDIVGDCDFVGVYGTNDFQGNTTWSSIQQISLNMSALKPYMTAAGTDCFYIQFYFEVNGTPYSIYTEGFKFEICKDSLLIEGLYTGKDCYGQYYGDNVVGNGNWTNFNYNYRLKGFLELDSISINKEFVGYPSKAVTGKTKENYTLLTDRVPEQVVRMLINMMTAPTVNIDGIEYVVSGDITKNNEIGNQWFLEIPLTIDNCSQGFGNCNN